MHGRLAAYELFGNVTQSVYQVGTDKYSTITVNFANKANVGTRVSIALTDAESTVQPEDYILYDHFVEPNSAYERASIAMTAGQYLTVSSSIGECSVVVWGFEIGNPVTGLTPITQLSDTVAPVIETTSIIDMVNDEAVSVQLVADGGHDQISFAVQSGATPTGTSLSSTGLLSGTPTGYPAGTTPVSFTVRATDNAGNFSDQAYTLNVTNPIQYVTGDGGTETVDGSYNVHTYTSVGSTTFEIVNI